MLQTVTRQATGATPNELKESSDFLNIERHKVSLSLLRLIVSDR